MEIADLIKKDFYLRLAAIVRAFDLRKLPARMKGDFYRRHVGRTDRELSREKTDKASRLASA